MYLRKWNVAAKCYFNLWHILNPKISIVDTPAAWISDSRNNGIQMSSESILCALQRVHANEDRARRDQATTAEREELTHEADWNDGGTILFA